MALHEGSMPLNIGTWRGIVPPLGTAPGPGPDFLRLRPSAVPVALRSGQLALVQPVETHPSRLRPVEIRRADGAVCGRIDLPVDDGMEAIGSPIVGADGTLVEVTQSCDGKSCRCSFRWWPGLLR
jgi:hypothetical protein